MLRYLSEAALETMGEAFEDACKTLREFNSVFIRELKRPRVHLTPARQHWPPPTLPKMLRLIPFPPRLTTFGHPQEQLPRKAGGMRCRG